MGHFLARLAAKYGYEQIGQARLTNDALITISAGRLGIKVLTEKLARLPSARRIPRFSVAGDP